MAGQESKVSSSWVTVQGHPEPELGLAQLAASLHLSEFLKLGTFFFFHTVVKYTGRYFTTDLYCCLIISFSDTFFIVIEVSEHSHYNCHQPDTCGLSFSQTSLGHSFSRLCSTLVFNAEAN